MAVQLFQYLPFGRYKSCAFAHGSSTFVHNEQEISTLSIALLGLDVAALVYGHYLTLEVTVMAVDDIHK